MKNYTDRDYFDEKFRNIDIRFDSLNEKLDKLHKTVYGDSNSDKKGLVEKVRGAEDDIGKLSKYIKATVIALIAFLPFEIAEVRGWLFKIINLIF